MSSNLSVQSSASSTSQAEGGESAEKQKPMNDTERKNLQRGIAALEAAANGDFSTALTIVHQMRTTNMHEEIERMVLTAQEYGPLETAADSLISSLRTAQASDQKQKIEVNEHMRDFIDRARKENPPQSDTTENSLSKLEKGEKLSGAEASDLLAYLEESKEKIIPQGKRAATLTQQIKGLQDRYEQENREAASRNSALI